MHGSDEGGEVDHFVADAEERGFYDLDLPDHFEEALVWVVRAES